MAIRRRLRQELKTLLAGIKTATLEIAHRTDRSMQLAKLRLDLWESTRELTLAYSGFGQRVAELSSTGPGAVSMPADDPELKRLGAAIEQLQGRLRALTQRIAALHLEVGEPAAMEQRRRLQAAGFAEVAVTIGPNTLYCGHRLGDLPKQHEWTAVAVIRHGMPFVPTGATVLTAGDEWLLFGPAAACEAAKLSLEQPAPLPVESSAL